MSTSDRPPLHVGDMVSKTSGYIFEGEVRAVYTNRKGEWRVVVEIVNPMGNGDGMQHIFSPAQLQVTYRSKAAWEKRDGK